MWLPERVAEALLRHRCSGQLMTDADRRQVGSQVRFLAVGEQMGELEFDCL
jgi:hypothetical protein